LPTSVPPSATATDKPWTDLGLPTSVPPSALAGDADAAIAAAVHKAPSAAQILMWVDFTSFLSIEGEP
jgi:hypothetical protein